LRQIKASGHSFQTDAVAHELRLIPSLMLYLGLDQDPLTVSAAKLVESSW
jgi:hypothetical protein